MIIAVDKPIGPTSHDIVAMARRQLGTRKVGHAGTLDPLASGVLLLLSEEHTRLSNFLTASDKSYLAWVSFGGTTATLDAEGPLEPGPVPSVSELAERLPGLLPGFTELTEQVPPSYSAVKHGGVKGYEAARRGEERQMPARAAGYRQVELLALAGDLGGLPKQYAVTAEGHWAPAPGGREFGLPPELAPLPAALIRLQVRAGTYIRAFARDLGEQLGCGAFLSGLVRTDAGRVGLQEAVPVDSIGEARGLAPLEVLTQPVVRLDAGQVARVRLGQRLRPDFSGVAALTSADGELVAMAEAAEGRMKLLAVFPAAD